MRTDPVLFRPETLTVKAGSVVFFVQNVPGAIQNGQPVGATHDMFIGPDRDHPVAESDVLKPGQAEVFTVQGLAPGTYTFWCSISDHAREGMVGTLTVTP